MNTLNNGHVVIPQEINISAVDAKTTGEETGEETKKELTEVKWGDESWPNHRTKQIFI